MANYVTQNVNLKCVLNKLLGEMFKNLELITWSFSKDNIYLGQHSKKHKTFFFPRYAFSVFGFVLVLIFLIKSV